MNVLIVDDEPLALERLRFAFQDIPDATLVGEAVDGIDAAEKVRALSPDLVILDIQMPGRTGLAVAKELSGDTRPEVVFVTAYEHYAPDAFEVEAVDYLMKPVRFDRLRQAVERARRRRAERFAFAGLSKPAEAAAERDDDIVVPDPRGDRRVPVKTIDWIEAAKDYALLHTPSRSHMIRMTMAELERRLDPAMMVRIHRSAFVRADAVARAERIERGGLNLVLHDGTELSVGPSYLRSVGQLFPRDERG